MRNCLLAVSFFLVTACATYQAKVSDAYNDLKNGNAAEAVKKLKPLAEKEGDDQLVYLLDYGVALQAAGDYKESIEVFRKADKLSEIKDYHSISRIAGSFLLSEGMVQYKGEDFEKVLINAYLATNYLMLGNLEDALVEARRLNEKLYKYKFEAKRDYEQNPFARYLSAMMWEAQRDWDNAYIDYAESYKLNPTIPQLKPRLIFAAKKAQRPEEVDKWKRLFPGSKPDPRWDDPAYGEVIIVYQQGQGPEKRPNPAFSRVPKLFPRRSQGVSARLIVDGQGDTKSEEVFDSEHVSIQTLDDAYAGLIAKRVGGLATKAIVSDQIRQKNEVLGLVSWVGLNLADQADLRQWSSLPQTFQVIRQVLKVGKYKIKVEALNSAGVPTGEQMPEREIEIKPRAKVFLNWRSFR